MEVKPESVCAVSFRLDGGYRIKDTGYTIQDTGIEGCKCKDTRSKDTRIENAV